MSLFKRLFGREDRLARVTPAASANSTGRVSLQPRSQMSELSYESTAARDEYLRSVTCECGGSWRVTDRTFVAEGPVREHVSVECTLCGLIGQFTFNFDAANAASELPDSDVTESPGDSEPGGEFDDADDYGHYHRYVFAHRVLPELVFEDPEGFLGVFADDGAERLRRLWDDIGQQVSKMDKRRAVSGEELDLHVANIAGRRAALITLPEPLETAEAHFVAVVDGDPAKDDFDWRYLVLERTESEDTTSQPDAVLCEWLPGGGRRNHARHCVPDLDRFVETVSKQLVLEDNRREHGAPRIAAPSWRPRTDEPTNLPFSEDGFRIHHCIFAFKVLPDALFAGLAGDALTAGVNVAALDALWERAGSLCSSAGEPVIPVPELRADVFAHVGVRWLVVTLPQPFSPPEPHFIAAPVAGGRAEVVYTFERANLDPDSPPLLSRIDRDGSHAVIGMVKDNSVQAFLEAAVSVHAGHRLTPPSDTMAQLIRYSRVYSVARN